MTAVDAPHEFHPDLSPERLAAIESVVRETRAATFAALKKWPRLVWSAGCMAYEGTLFAFEDLSQEVSWLGFEREGLGYVLTIGDVPIRVQRNDKPPKPVLDIEAASLKRPGCQMMLPFDDSGLKLSDCVIRLEFEADGPRTGACALCVWSRDETKKRVLYHSWSIGTSDTVAVVEALPRHEPEQLEPALFDVGDDNRHGESDAG